MSILPTVFLIGAAGMLLGGLFSLWSSFRAAFGASDVPDLQGTIEAMSRQQLLEQKQTLLQTLQDLRFDRDAGKISERDFGRLEKSLRERAKDVLRLLDADVEPFRRKAEEMIKARLKDEKSTPYREAKKPLVDRLACPECDTDNDSDAVFCKKCGHSFAKAVVPDEVLEGLDPETAEKARKVLDEAAEPVIREALAKQARSEEE